MPAGDSGLNCDSVTNFEVGHTRAKLDNSPASQFDCHHDADRV